MGVEGFRIDRSVGDTVMKPACPRYVTQYVNREYESITMPVISRQTPAESHRHLQSEDVFASLIDQHGYLALQPAEDSFKRLVRSIVRQQVSMAAADAMCEQLFTRFDVNPTRMIEVDPAALTEAGLSGAKAEYVNNVAHAFVQRGWSREYFQSKTDEEVIEELVQVTGIGPWTAKMYLQFGLGREDVFPVEDLGIRRAHEELFGDETRAEMRSRATGWAPYRSIASLYLWRSTEK